MAPFTKATESCSDANLKRFACCFLHIKEYNGVVDWDAAAADFDPKTKAASFRTQVGRAMKGLYDNNGEGDGEITKAKAKPRAKAASKRKKAEDAEEGDGEGIGDEKPAAKKTKAAKGQGGKKGGEVEVKAEEGGDGGEANGEVDGGMGDEAFV